MPAQSREELTIEEGRHQSKNKTSTGVVFLGIFASLMTIGVIVLGVLYGLEVEKQASATTEAPATTTPTVIVTQSPTTTTPPPSTTTPPKTTAPSTTPGGAQNELCQSKECVSAASRILNAMNTDVQPCDDFFEYACGKWVQDHIIPDDKSTTSTFNDLREDVSKVLKRVLEPPSTDADRSAIKKAKDFYADCMNTTSIDELATEPVKELIVAMDGWPVLDGSYDLGESLEEKLARFRSQFSTYGVLSSWVGADDKNSSANIFHLDQPSLGMPSRDYYLDAALRASVEPGYRMYMEGFMTMIAGEDAAAVARIPDVVNEIIAFETQIAEIMAPDSERRDTMAIYKKTTLRDLNSSVADFNFETYVGNVMSVVEDEVITIDETEEVVTYAAEYLESVASVVNGSLELMQNYLVWRVLKDRTTYMSAELRATRQPYTQAISGTTVEEARWKTCSDTTNSYFPMPVGALFVEEAFAEENKEATEVMVENLRTAFKEMLPENDWMDSPTKDQAKAKADQIIPIIAYPDYILEGTNSQLDDEYEDAQVVLGQFFGNIQSLSMLDTKSSLGKLRKPVDFEEWVTSPAIVNAFYSPSRNQIVFPAGILQPPFYDAGQPASMNYGSIGMVIGHEITHGFDDSGAQFDGNGNLENWWTESSKANFEEKSQCMSEQYSSISWSTAKGAHIDGNLTLGENIADNGGLRQAYRAYKKWQENNPQGDLLLPGMSNFTQDQLFFIGNAQVWCGSYTTEYAIRLLKTDPHSPGEFRVMVPNQNFDEFGKAFSCTRGKDEMFPPEEETCRVW